MGYIGLNYLYFLFCLDKILDLHTIGAAELIFPSLDAKKLSDNNVSTCFSVFCLYDLLLSLVEI